MNGDRDTNLICLTDIDVVAAADAIENETLFLENFDKFLSRDNGDLRHMPADKARPGG